MSVDTGFGNKMSKRLKLAAVVSKASKQGNKKSASPFLQKRGTGGSGKTMVSDRKKKRVYANHGGLDDLASSSTGLKTDRRTSSSAKKRFKAKADLSDDNANGINKSSRTMWTNSKKKHGKTTKEAAKTTAAVLKTKTQEEVEKLVKERQSSRKSDKQMDKSRNKRSDVLSLKAPKQLGSEKTVLDDGSGSQEDLPKKRKRIRIDPHDISNKRLDDDIIPDGSNEKKVQEKTVGMSKNAQFRAIQPSPSILSYVEENLLGRRRLIDLRKAGYNTELSVPLDNIPSSTSTERERIEESIFRNKLTFFAAAKTSSSLPPPDVPEIAFAGRSNVGKSSLLNALTRQWGVARTSDKPGLTQTINFFNLGPKVRLVDLPGYGFAYAKDEVKEAWEEFVKEYVSKRTGLKRVCLLIDTKWGVKPRDHELINLMERANTKYQVVLTKTDIVFPMDVARRAMEIEEKLKANKSVVQPVMMVSSKSGAGIRSLRTVLAKIARFAKV